MTTLVTGSAGFIGYHVSRMLLERGDDVVGFDVVNDYYDPALKEARLADLCERALAAAGSYTFIRANLADRQAVDVAFATHKPRCVINLAAQAGVRYSLENPHAYVESNIVGFTNLLEACRAAQVDHLVYASTSSVYGANTTMPFSESADVGHPLQFYAATKRANELMAHAYSHLYRLPTTGLRFFTVYGPWGRPDMAPFKFAANILNGAPIPVFNHGNHSRDFTFVDDIAEGVLRVADKPAQPNPDWDSSAPDPASSNAPFRIYNIGNNTSVRLMDFIHALEKALGKKAQLDLLPLQPGDVPDTYASVDKLMAAVDYRPTTPVEQGVAQFVSWYRGYYGV